MPCDIFSSGFFVIFSLTYLLWFNRSSFWRSSFWQV